MTINWLTITEWQTEWTEWQLTEWQLTEWQTEWQLNDN